MHTNQNCNTLLMNKQKNTHTHKYSNQTFEVKYLNMQIDSNQTQKKTENKMLKKEEQCYK